MRTTSPTFPLRSHDFRGATRSGVPRAARERAGVLQYVTAF